jgi:two-component system, chemotaxis family, protein-glutamate methylesterase/glutaminase
MMATPSIDAIVIGASAGAIEALLRILTKLPPSYSIPVLVVVHLSRNRKRPLAELYQHHCDIRVVEAEEKLSIEPGTVYFAPSDYHLLVEMNKTLSLSNEEPVNFSRPSIDLLFDSASDAYEQSLLGIVLTGANRDGANGLKKIMDRGGQGIVQQPSSAFASSMPQAALDSSPKALVMELDEIANHLKNLEHRR